MPPGQASMRRGRFASTFLASRLGCGKAWLSLDKLLEEEAELMAGLRGGGRCPSETDAGRAVADGCPGDDGCSTLDTWGVEGALRCSLNSAPDASIPAEVRARSRDGELAFPLVEGVLSSPGGSGGVELAGTALDCPIGWGRDGSRLFLAGAGGC